MTSTGKAAPYAPPANVIGIIQRYRDRNLPEEIDTSILLDVGISKGNVHRTVAALKFLKLIDEAGVPTATFASLQAATDEQYRQIMLSLVKNAYEGVFRAGIDPSKDSQLIIDNHFRRFEPGSQRSRMVTLFQGLCREAGIPLVDAPRERAMKGASPAKHKRHTSATATPVESVTSQVPSVSSLRREYVSALIERVRQGDTDEQVLERIEKLLAEEENAGAKRSDKTDSGAAAPLAG